MPETNTNTPCLILPMEVSKREIYGKLLIAIEGAKHGWESYIGDKNILLTRINKIPPGIIIFKSGTPKELDIIKRMKAAGHKVMVLDEEGLVQFTDEHIALRFSKEVMGEISGILSWGKKQVELLEQAFPDHKEKIKPTGNPRINIWRAPYKDIYKPQKTDIENRFGRYIFFPSSFGIVNHFLGTQKGLEYSIRAQKINSEADIKYLENYMEYTRHVFEAYLKFLPKLAQAFPDHKLIVRPHPSGNPKTWQKLAQKHTNIIVNEEYEVTPWLLGADLILQWGSTTGIEAHILGKPVVSFDPMPDEEHKKYAIKLADAISVLTKTEQETLEKIRVFLDEPQKALDEVSEGHELLKSWILNLEDGSAPAQIMDILKTVKMDGKTAVPILKTTKESATAKTEHLVWDLLAHISRMPLFNHLFPTHIKDNLGQRIYKKRKGGALLKSDLEDSLSRLLVFEEPDLKIRAETVTDHVFHLQREL